MKIAEPERRMGENGVLRLMVCAEGYCMVRRPGCSPFIMTERTWERLPIWTGAPAKPQEEARL